MSITTHNCTCLKVEHRCPKYFFVFFVLNASQAHNETVLTLTNHVCVQGKQRKEACTVYFTVKKPRMAPFLPES